MVYSAVRKLFFPINCLNRFGRLHESVCKQFSASSEHPETREEIYSASRTQDTVPAMLAVRPFISRRVSIQWLPPTLGTPAAPSPPSEPTSTLVLSDASAPGGSGVFVDIRIQREALRRPDNNILNPKAGDIDWALAGVCTSTPLGPAEQIHDGVVCSRRAVFTHEIDSRMVLGGAEDDSDELDVGYMRAAPDSTGDELERAFMLNPKLGVRMACEERWRDEEPTPRLCIIMKTRLSPLSQDTQEPESPKAEGPKGQLILLGTHMQAILTTGPGELSLQRWKFKAKGPTPDSVARQTTSPVFSEGVWTLIAACGPRHVIPSPDCVLKGKGFEVADLVWYLVQKIQW